MSVIDHPSYYNSGRIEVIDFIEDQGFNFSLGNAVKYISRAGRKSVNAVEDLKKAAWYINREIERQMKLCESSDCFNSAAGSDC